MKPAFSCFVIMLLAGGVFAAHGQPVDLSVYPAEAPQQKDKYGLLPKAEDLVDADALVLYDKAIASLPQNLDQNKIRRWTQMPLDKLPIKEIEATLQRLKGALEPAKQAGKCKKAKWPVVKPGTFIKGIDKYRVLAFILALEARVQIAKGRYKEAIETMQTGFSMARHLTDGPMLIQGLVGIAVAASILDQAEELVQQADAPNLYWAFEKLPRPLADLTNQMEQEMQGLKRQVINPWTRSLLKKQLKPAHDRTRVMMKKLDRQVVALQLVEALRLYAAAHEGKFPVRLKDVTDASIPEDPVTGKAFIYSSSGDKAVIEAPAPEGARPEDALRYNLTLKRPTQAP